MEERKEKKRQASTQREGEREPMEAGRGQDAAIHGRTCSVRGQAGDTGGEAQPVCKTAVTLGNFLAALAPGPSRKGARRVKINIIMLRVICLFDSR